MKRFSSRQGRSTPVISSGSLLALVLAGAAWADGPKGPSGPAPDPFDRALKEARSYAIQYNDPASIREGLNRYHKVLTAFPRHPRLHEAKRGIFNVLRVDGTRESLAQAVPLAAELVDGADLTTPAGQEMALMFLEFHLANCVGYPFQNLAKAEAVIRRLLELSQKEERSLLGLQVQRYLGKLRIWREQHLEALQGLLETLEKAQGWGPAFWNDLFKRDTRLYDRYSVELTNIAATAGYAVEQSRDPGPANLLRQKPGLVNQYKILRKQLDAFNKRPKPVVPVTDLPQPSGGIAPRLLLVGRPRRHLPGYRPE